jgi:large subunit ribosomal protein L17
MRHGNKINHLSRTTAHRAALLRNLSNALISHKRIVTTLAKAKELRVFIEPLVSKSRVDVTANRRLVFSRLQRKEIVKELFGVVAPKVGDRPGGYTRILKLGPRRGDAAEMAMIEFVDFNDLYIKPTKEKESTGRRRRSRRGGGGAKSASAPVAAAPVTPEAPVSNEPDAQAPAVEATAGSDNA